MAAANPNAPFRFMDLPGELRNKVYALLLCSFATDATRTEDQSEDESDDSDDEFALIPVQHWNDPAILRVNSQVHREAYDVMVKTNRFIRISSPDGLPFGKMVANRTPSTVVSGQSAAQFKAQLIDITISSTEPDLNFHQGDNQSRSVVILGCEFDNFCDCFEVAETYIPGLIRTTTFVITVAPTLTHQLPRYKDDLTDFFTEAIQRDILGPLTTMRGIKSVEVRGYVEPDVAANLQELMTSDEWEDPQSAWKKLKEYNDEADEMFQQEDELEDAFLVLGEVMRVIDHMLVGSSWNKLVSMGGDDWVNNVAELKCSLGIKTSEAITKRWGPTSRDARSSRATHQKHRLLAEGGLIESDNCSIEGYWKRGYEWVCPALLKKQILLQKARCIWHWGEAREAVRANVCIRAALRLDPHDAEVVGLAVEIAKWLRDIVV